MKSPLICLINEYSDTNSPVSKLVFDLAAYLEAKDMRCSMLYAPGTYRPGGLQVIRVFNLFLLHALGPAWILYCKLKGLILGRRVCIVVATNPPLIQWTAILFGKILFCKVVVWYMDAHPEVEARFFESKGFTFIAKGLRSIDHLFLPHADKVVALDGAISEVICSNHRRVIDIEIIPPWATYIHPAKPLRVNLRMQFFRLIYAGNYGASHDLQPLSQLLCSLPQENQFKIKITFVGMNSSAKLTLAQCFESFLGEINFLDRFNNLPDLCREFVNFDFGLVSLSANKRGLACPSKALSYISQGLPIAYIGPNDTLSFELVQNGWGVIPSRDFFLKGTIPEKLRQNCEKIFRDISIDSKVQFHKVLMELVEF